MNWLPVARKDFQDSIRSRTLIAVVSLLVLFAVGLAAAYVEYLLESGTSAQDVTHGFVAFATGRFPLLPGPASALVPLIGLLLGYKSIVGERESGSIKLLLSLPHTRGDVVVGKFVGRTTVAVVAVVVGFVVSGVLLLTQGAALGPYVVFLLCTALFIAVHVAMGIGISALVGSQGWATLMLFLVVGGLQAAWGAIFAAVGFFGFDNETPEWFDFLSTVSPARSYNHVLEALVPGFESFLTGDNPTGGGPGTQPLDLPDAAWLPILLAWGLLPLAIGYARFRADDLG